MKKIFLTILKVLYIPFTYIILAYVLSKNFDNDKITNILFVIFFFHIAIYGILLEKKNRIDVANTMYLQGDFYGAIKEFELLKNIYKFRRKIYICEIFIYFDNEYFDEVKTLIKKIRIRRNEYNLIYIRGYMYQLANNYEEAIICYEKLYNKNKNEILIENLGISYFNTNEFDKALLYFHEYFELNNKNSEINSYIERTNKIIAKQDKFKNLGDNMTKKIDKFEFEHTIDMDDKIFKDIYSTPARTSLIKKKLIVRILKIFLALIVLFILFKFKYTIGLGIVVALLLVLGIVTPIFDRTLTKSGLRAIYNDSKFLHDEITYGIDEKYIYVKTEKMEQKAEWSLLHVWTIRADWLQLNITGMAVVFIPISKLEENGLKEIVFNYLEKYGVEYNTKKTINY